MSIDSRIVEMKFDNAEFERNAKTSMDTLKKLDENLKMEEGVKGLANVAKSVSNVSFAPMVEGLERVSSRFSALEVAAITVVSRITNSVMDAAKNIVNALAIEPITSGMQEYEMKMDNVQTTMINSGKSLEEVNATLDDLNHYADKTIFKFSDMTSALSKFTMAGITDLNLASTMIEGIGNIAGESGLKTEQASSAFYMISQAMSAGNMALYQWRTLETTGFASNKFRENLLETAVALGKIQKLQNGMYRAQGVDEDFDAGSMRNSLTKGKWFDKELMQTIFARYASEEASAALGFEDISEAAFHAAQDVKTFTQMFDTLKEAAQSGWTETWQLIIGDYEQAKALWTGVNEVISGILDKQSENRNAILKEWQNYTGRQYLIDGLRIAWTKLSNVVNSFKDAFKNVFPPITGKRLAELSLSFYKLAENIGFGSTKGGYLELTFRKILEVVKTLFGNIKKIGKTIKDAFTEIFEPTKSVFELFTENRLKIYQFFSGLKNQLTLSDESAEKLKNTFKGLFSIFDITIEFVKSLYKFLSPLFEKFFPKIGKLGDGVLNLSSGLGEGLYQLRNWIKENNAFDKMFERLVDGFNKVKSVIEKITDFIVTNFGPAWDTLTASIKNAFSKDDEEKVSFFETVWNVFTKIISGIGKALEVLFPILKKVFQFFGKIISNVFEGLSDFVDMASQNGIGGALAAITTGFATLLGLNLSWKVFDGIGDFIAAIKELAGSLKDNFISFVDTFIGGFNELKDSAVFDLRVDALKRVAAAVLMLAVAFFILAQCDPKSIAVSMTAVTAAIGELLTLMLTFSKIGGGSTKLLSRNPFSDLATQMISIASSVLILSLAMKILSTIDLDELLNAIIAMAVIFGGMTLIIAALTKSLTTIEPIIKNPKMIKNLGKVFTYVAEAILIMAIAVKILSTMDIQEAIIGVGSLVVLMLAIGVLVKALPVNNAENLKKIGSSILIMSLGLLIIAAAMRIIGTMDVDSALVALASIIGIILAVAFVANTFQTINTKGILSVAAAIAIMAAGILIFAIAMKVLETVNIESAIASLLAIMIMVAALIFGSEIVNPVGIMSIAGALVIFAAAILVLALALKALEGMDLARMAASLGIVIAAFAVFMVLGTVATMFPVILAGTAALVTVFLEFAAAIALLGIGALLLSAGLSALAVSGVAGISALVVMITELLSLLPMAATMLAAAVVAFITGLASETVSIINAIVAIGLAILEALIQLIPKFCEFIEVLIVNLIDTTIKLVPVFIDGMIRFAIAVIDTIVKWLKEMFKRVGPIIEDLWTNIKEAFSGWYERMREKASEIWQGFIDGVTGAIDKVVDKAKEMANKVVNTVKEVFDIHSPSKVMRAIGVFVDEGLANGLNDKAGAVVTAAESIGDATLNGIRSVLTNISDIIENDKSINPTISPVMDLSNVTSGARSLARMLSGQNGGTIAATVNGRLSSIGGTVSNSSASKQPIINQYDLIQNNYSPKALNRIDIYRQTENQFSRLKGAISAS